MKSPLWTKSSSDEEWQRRKILAVLQDDLWRRQDESLDQVKHQTAARILGAPCQISDESIIVVTTGTCVASTLPLPLSAIISVEEHEFPTHTGSSIGLLSEFCLAQGATPTEELQLLCLEKGTPLYVESESKCESPRGRQVTLAEARKRAREAVEKADARYGAAVKWEAEREVRFEDSE
ncbi:MAG: hypothetical protein WBG50_11665 [Desulfomonilaceae bacterium]